MRHVFLIIIFLLIAGLVFCWTWRDLAHPSKNTLITVPLESAIENICNQKQIPIKDLGILFGKDIEDIVSGFKLLNNNLSRVIPVGNLETFLAIKPSLIYRGWVITGFNYPRQISKIYWILEENTVYFYYFGEIFKIDRKSIISPEIIKAIRHQSNSYWWVVLLIIGEAIIGLYVLAWIDRKIFGRNLWSNRGETNQQKIPDFPKKNLADNPIVVVDIHDYYGYFSDKQISRVRLKTPLMLRNGEFLGRANFCIDDKKDRENYKYWLEEFLNKFGKRLHLDDKLDALFALDWYKRYQIRFQTLLAGYTCFKRGPEEFIENVRKAKNEEEFLILCGLF